MPGEQFKTHVGLTKPSGLLHGTTTRGARMDTIWYQLWKTSPAFHSAENTTHFSVAAIVVIAHRSSTIVSLTTVTVLPRIHHVVSTEVSSLHKANGVIAICTELNSESYSSYSAGSLWSLRTNIYHVIIIYMYITNKCDLLSKNPAYIPNLKYWIKTKIMIASTPGHSLNSKVIQYLASLVPRRFFAIRRKNAPGDLPIPFWFWCAGMLAHCSILIYLVT